MLSPRERAHILRQAKAKMKESIRYLERVERMRKKGYVNGDVVGKFKMPTYIKKTIWPVKSIW